MTLHLGHRAEALNRMMRGTKMVACVRRASENTTQQVPPGPVIKMHLLNFGLCLLKVNEPF
jgi:hypothetical protein